MFKRRKPDETSREDDIGRNLRSTIKNHHKTVNFDVVVGTPVRASGGTLSSRALPSLREEYADFAKIGSSSFCMASIETPNGVEYLFGHMFKVLRRLQSASSISRMEEFMQLLGLLEFVGMSDDLVKSTVDFQRSYRNFLFKVGPLCGAAANIPTSGCTQNIPFHIALFAWHTACKLFNKQTTRQPSDGSTLSGDDAMKILLTGIAAIRKKCGSCIQCSCVQSVLVDLYRYHAPKVLELCLRIMQSLINGESLLSLESFKGSTAAAASATEFFEFTTEIISHFIDIRLMPLEEITSRFVLLVGIGELLCETEPLLTFKILYSFIKKHQIKGFMKIRKSASKFITKILQTIESTEIPEIERMSRDEPSRWAEHVKSSFKFCTSEEMLLIQFLLELLSDRQLSSCSGIVVNRYSSVKLLSDQCVLPSALSLLLAIIFTMRGSSAAPDGELLAAKFCEWITECVKNADDEDCNILFNALDVLASIGSGADSTKIFTVIINCLNELPLPEKNLVFTRRCAVVLRTYPNDSNKVNMDRFVSTASEPELLGLLYRLADADVEISGSIWNEAAKLFATSRAKDAKLSDFVVNQLAAGIRTRTTQSSSRFKWCIEKLSCAQPDANFLFSFCNGVLARLEGQQTPIISKLLSLWIYAVMAHSTSRELDTKGFTSMIWDHIVRLLEKIQPITMDLSPGNSEAFISRFFEVLGTTKSFTVVRPLIEDGVPSKLAYQIVALLKSEDEEVQERVIRICCEMLRQIGPMLLKIAEEEAPRTGLNRTAFIVITQAVVSKIVKGSLNHDFLLQVVPTCIAAIAKLPYRMFIYSRIKDLLFKFALEETISHRMLDELASPECSYLTRTALACWRQGTERAIKLYKAYHKQLTKDSDERIKKLIKR